jgi:molybdopterin converting factor small subunit
MGVTVEFFGIARERAGRPVLEVCCGIESTRLGDVLLEVAERLPVLAGECLSGEHPQVGFLVNINAHRFLADPDALVHAGDHVLLMSADAGG